MSTSLFKALRTSAALSSAVLAFGYAGAAFAQAPSSADDMARCNQLWGAWSRYNGGSAYSKQVDAEASYEDCRKGNYQAGIGGLTRALQRQQIPVPPVETAQPR